MRRGMWRRCGEVEEARENKIMNQVNRRVVLSAMSTITITHYSITVRGSVAILGLRAFGPIARVVDVAPQPVRGNGGIVGKTRGKHHWTATMGLLMSEWIEARVAFGDGCPDDTLDVTLHYTVDGSEERVFAIKGASVESFSFRLSTRDMAAVRLGFNDEPPADIVGREFRIQSEDSP